MTSIEVEKILRKTEQKDTEMSKGITQEELHPNNEN